MQIEGYSKSRDYRSVIVDIIMLILVLANLGLLTFDLTFSNPTMQGHILRLLPSLHSFYLPIHRDFLLYDGIFVTIFISELLIRWTLAIYRQTYEKWFFYPFAHWYDVLGCIPAGSFRILRLLRVVSIVIRLERLGIINFRKTYIFRKFKEYLSILTEEISDRVVINVITGIQEEVRRGTPLTEKIVSNVILPHKEALVKFISHRIQKVTEDQYAANKDLLKDYVYQLIKEAVDQNREIQTFGAIPLAGPVIEATLRNAIRDITFRVVHQILSDLASPNNRLVVEKLADGIIETLLLHEDDTELNKMAVDIADRALELVKEHVAIKQWKATD